ncbi:helix-turn-helix domain-containing protein [Microbacterium sp. WCS2018Hpa-9]|uniref:helix-turn-helix domain-containing protein n=1 Tax=Microbacterium sp. WCS2018Hpa-9 TaxID=3073635 RepID=UPI00288B2420|nr:helix-turn-helix domain-containing protein [Microbacterium sp. WCS2018Hpa-9]
MSGNRPPGYPPGMTRSCSSTMPEKKEISTCPPDRSSTGATPAAWVRSRRLDEARRLLEAASLSIDQIAAACGFGSPITLRQNFMSAFGSTPSSYRRRFDARA